MLRIKTLLLGLVVVGLPMFAYPSDAEAGPLLDWIRNRCRRTSTPPSTPMFSHNTTGLQPGQCIKTCQQTCTRTVVNYVPHTAFRTEWKRVPVTQFRPVTTTDPCTGCTVTCMRPCTTFTYQCQRVPFTTFRPEFRTETFQVPVTTITNDCFTGTSGMPAADCPTCVPAGQAPSIMPGTFQSAPTDGTYYEYPATSAPLGSINNSGSNFQTTIVPADTRPSLGPQSSVQPLYNQIQAGDRVRQSAPANYQQPTPAYYPPEQTAEHSVRREWNYSPVRLASHTAEVVAIDEPVKQPRYSATLQVGKSSESRFSSENDNLNGWKVVK